MAKLQSNSEFLLDNRVVKRNLRDGRLLRTDFEEFLDALPDLKDLCEDIGDEVYGKKKHAVAVAGDFISSEQDEE